MSRAAKRRAERLAAKLGGKVEQKPPQQMIKLQNPVSDQFEMFIFGNSLTCEHVVEPGSAVGQSVVICGAGPSLADEAAEYCNTGDQLWGCNSALTWLLEHGYPVTHGITVDQTPAMLIEWESAPDVEYLVASTIHPHLADHLTHHDRRLRYFHNFVGIKKPPVEWCKCGHNHEGEACHCGCESYDPVVMSYEDWMYLSLYPATVRVGAGLNTCTRAIDLALVMGFDKITVVGADCALRVKRPMPSEYTQGSPEHQRWLVEDTVMHADGGHALASGATPTTMGGKIDGRHWETKPDMAISAMFMVRLRQHYPDRLVYVGDTLPNALEGKSEDFLAKMPVLLDGDGNPIPITLVEPLRTGDVMAPALEVL